MLTGKCTILEIRTVIRIVLRGYDATLVNVLVVKKQRRQVVTCINRGLAVPWVAECGGDRDVQSGSMDEAASDILQ